MTIKAILRDGQIKPLEPLPTAWADGQELVIEEPIPADTDAHLDEWSRELEAAATQLPAEEHTRFQQAIKKIEEESKDNVRKEWGLP